MVYSYKYLCFYFKCNRFSSSIFGFDIFDCLTPSGINKSNMKHKFTVVIESNDDSENREVVKDCLQDWLEMNCGQEKDLGGYPDWKSVVVE